MEDGGDKQVGSGCVLKLEPTGVRWVWRLRKSDVFRPPPGFGPQNRERGAAVRRRGEMQEQGGAGGAGVRRRPRVQFWNCTFRALLGGACGHR